MFAKILIANRGEIACRVIDTARRMGVATVAVHSTADAASRHVAMADEAVAVGGPAPAGSYLRGEAIIAAALQTGAQAIHPGYGFLSENPEFVDAVTAAGLVFIGPSAAAIRAMGLKDAAKRLMAEAGVPVVPGYHGANQDPEHLAGAADTVGYPVLIKAVAGGGGKGMRRVERPEDFAEALASAQREAAGAFGNSAVLIEKYVEKPRHIEMQVFGDGTHAVHLYERDCSLQRRHQKVIEEAPAPGMTPQMRAAMGEAAVRAATAIGYSGAGTIEFIVDASDGLRPDRFWFMEMNTRLQVEHPVTEAITGIDLVEWQLRVASGEPLPLRQQDIPLSGHAFEARLYAEDVPAGFLPATGTLDHLAFPAGARIETGVRPGDTISPWYDPMIAKLVVHGPTRAVALAQLSRALAETEVAGSVTNLAFLGALARHPGFAAGDVDTGLIARDLAALTEVPACPPGVVALAALAAAGLDQPAAPQQGFSLWAPLRQQVTLHAAGEDIAATLQPHGPDRVTVELPGHTLHAERRGGAWSLDGAKAPGTARRTPHGIAVFGPAGTFTFTPVDPLARLAAAGAGGNVVLSPMPGLVKAVFVAPGQVVAEGERLAILEAMKMEHTLTAARIGIVAEVLAAAGDQVEAGAALVRLEDEEPKEAAA
ncbi:ATP-grasp domain-containing protein [Frigidibacter albus]|uniref:ATP-grasp domain-containing protein n=1 Tax=Frigidibacter albus TaxID=1465486 RepID=A0A6L8VEU7_9RHOB|nr:acetyl/propionyl/methylcrotonyl-CoA carboxylase subunit alpha [Frigidibacter albus]MZQ88236.1 ATP-grasp domain-containing protein [Frigidibacter albus]NBE30090.1 ATP-grasp domain-containing protein [Frigidibacter albus]GGH46632.1 3-methylcrotonyl-CoA carboxylase subunit alpha [Frigidibacter albus]